MDKKGNQNRAIQKNPNNLKYHQCRGSSTRPEDWESISQENKANGLLEHRANTAGAMSNEKRRTMGIYITRIEKVVKEQLGGNRSICVGGSQKKGVNVGTSDLDLKIDTPEQMTLDERTKLGQGLENEFGKENVDSDHSIIHVVKGKDISIDIVPSQAEYFPEGFKLEKKGVRPFLTNDRGRHAVRNLKEIDRSVPGIKIEETVLEIQQRSKGISLHDIIKEAGTELQKS